MLRIPKSRQPDDTACLPACVRAVLTFRGWRISDEEAAEICQTQRRGTILHRALDGLSDAGLDAELQQFDSTDALRELIDAGEPVVVVLRHPAGPLHAVVVCDVSADAVTVMDPAVGDYATLALDRFEDLWCRVQNEALLIGARAAQSTAGWGGGPDGE